MKTPEGSYEPVDTKLARRRSPRRCSSSASTPSCSGGSRGRPSACRSARHGEGRFRPAELRLLPARAGAVPRRAGAAPETYPWPSITAGSASSGTSATRSSTPRTTSSASPHPPRQIERLRRPGSRRCRVGRSANRQRGPARPPAGVFEKLRHQASLQLSARGRERQLRAARRQGAPRPPPPPAVAGDLFYDLEGDPFWSPGAGSKTCTDMLLDRVRARFATTRSGRTTAKERVALERVIDCVQERLAAHRDMHVYHYAAYKRRPSGASWASTRCARRSTTGCGGRCSSTSTASSRQAHRARRRATRSRRSRSCTASFAPPRSRW